MIGKVTVCPMYITWCYEYEYSFWGTHTAASFVRTVRFLYENKTLHVQR